MRALIVDDEPLARRGVALRLQRYKDIEVAGECGDGERAVEQILATSPDVVFLDVQMPGMNGFDVVRALPPESLPSIIFLTAYEQHALQAFEVHAVDYLLKPVDDARFAGAIERVRQRMDLDSRLRSAERVLAMLDRNSGAYLSRFVVKTGSRIQIVAADDVVWIGAAGDYVELHTAGRSHLIRETMNSLAEKLDPEKFLRIHRSRIVRSDRIAELRSIDNREFIVKLADGSEHRSSRTFAEPLEKWLESERR